MRKQVAIIGAGVTGLAAAYDLLIEGHQVTLYEASSETGGLASGFKDESWSWPLERFYHHLFQSDKEMLALVQQLGLEDKLFFKRGKTSVFRKGRVYPFDSISAFFRYPAFNLFDTLRFGAVSAFLRYTRFWRFLERHTADSWMRRWYGEKVYNVSWKPILIGKFGEFYDQVNMAWMWARLYARSFKLGYFEGGFQTLVDGLTTAVLDLGGTIQLESPIEKIESFNDGLVVTTAGGESSSYDQCLVTTSPQLFLQLTPSLEAIDQEYADLLRNLKSIGAIVVVLASHWPLLKNTYWLNLPATDPTKRENDIPFLALIEHTNFIDKKHYGSDNVFYLGDYLPTDHPYFSYSDEELVDHFLDSLPEFNPNFKKTWIRKSWVFRANYAQPIPLPRHSKNLPELETPIPGLYFASMSQVYPWDRGTNFAVEIGRRVAQLMLKAP